MSQFDDLGTEPCDNPPLGARPLDDGDKEAALLVGDLHDLVHKDDSYQYQDNQPKKRYGRPFAATEDGRSRRSSCEYSRDCRQQHHTHQRRPHARVIDGFVSRNNLKSRGDAYVDHHAHCERNQQPCRTESGPRYGR